MYEAPSLIKKILGIATWSSLFLLIPLAALGVFSESTIPGQTLYPVKRTIESIVLGFDSFDNKTKAFYTVYLVDRRFSETETLLVDNPILLDTSLIHDFTGQIESARDTINSIVDSNERKALRAQLIRNISDYRNQLAALQPQPQPNQPALQNNFPSPTTSPSVNQNDQIDQLQQQLRDLQNQIQQDQNNNVSKPSNNIANPDTHVTPSVPTPTSVPNCSCYIKGSPFIDLNGNGIRDAGEDFYYTNSSPLTYSLYDRNGSLILTQKQTSTSFAFTYLSSDTTYTVKLDYVPSGFFLTTPQSFVVLLGNTVCDIGNSKDALCINNGSIDSLNFGLEPIFPTPSPTPTPTPSPIPTDIPTPTPDQFKNDNGNGNGNGNNFNNHAGWVVTPTDTSTSGRVLPN